MVRDVGAVPPLPFSVRTDEPEEWAVQPTGVDGLVFQYLERVEAGEGAGAVLDELCGSHPEAESALRRGVALLVQTRLHPGPAGQGVPARVGPFRLLRRLGQGGMGVVYLAEQEHPRRQVALKLVRPDQLWFDGARERFRREVESAGRLAHPGIAPVFEVGEQDGLPWFSQEFVRGASLEALLRAVPTRAPESLSGADMRLALEEVLAIDGADADARWDEGFFAGSWVQASLRIARRVAEALEHAHERGVLHRDVKPSNVLITPEGRVVLVDFGLAALAGASSLTRSGTLLGSLPYMPPEQVDGRTNELCPSADVYSLAVTLFELLTLRAPYSSGSVERLRGQILAGTWPSLRRWNPAASQDVATVVRCGMDVDPRRRYPSAAAFGADLANVIERRPIQARPAGVTRRVVRWCQRRPALATAVVLAVLLCVGAPVMIAVLNARAAERERGISAQLADALAGETDARQLAEARFGALLDALGSVLRRASKDRLRDVPAATQARLEIVEDALKILDRLEPMHSDDLLVEFRCALIHRTHGDVLFQLGREEEALEAYGRAGAGLARVAADPGCGADEVQEYASMLSNHGGALNALGRQPEAFPLYRRAITLMRRARALEPESVHRDADLATSISNYVRAARVEPALSDDIPALLEEGAGVARRAVSREPGSAEAWGALFGVLFEQSRYVNFLGRYERALEVALEAIAAAEQAVELEPGVVQYREDLVHVLYVAASSATSAGDHESGAVLAEEGMERIEALIYEFPDVHRHVETRLTVLGTLANALFHAGEEESAFAMFAEVAEEREARAAERPGDLDRAMDAARALVHQATYLASEGGRAPAEYRRGIALADRAFELAQPVLAADPDRLDYQKLRFTLDAIRASGRCALGEPEPALVHLEAMDAALGEMPVTRYKAATVWATYVATVEESQLEPERRAALRARALDRAMELLVQAAEGGFSQPERLERSASLSALADDPRYQRALGLVRRASVQ